MSTSQESVEIDPRLKRGTVLRRHMDLAKLLDFLRTKQLYLRRSDRFVDRLEGALSPGHRKLLDGAHRLSGRGENADTFYRRARMGTYASCWTIGAKDNMALWQLFGGAATSVAITTTVDRLHHAIEHWAERTVLKKIDYVEFDNEVKRVIGRYTDPLEFKHIAYSFEHEARLLVSRHGSGWEQNPEGLRLPIRSLNALVRSIVVAPEAETWFFELVADATERYGVSRPVRHSALTSIPA